MAKPRASQPAPAKETKIRAGGSPTSEGGVIGQMWWKEKEEGIPQGKRQESSEGNQGAGRSQRRARSVEAEEVDSPQDSLGVEEGRNLPSFGGSR